MKAAELLNGWDDLRSGFHRTADELRELQLARLRSIVAHAYDSVPYYRKLFDSAGFHPRHLKTLADVGAIPLTTRASLQTASPDDLIARGYARERLRATRTGGSTGTPLTVYRSLNESRLSMLLRMRTWRHHGMRASDRTLTISAMQSTAGKKHWLRALPVGWRWNHNVLDDIELVVQTFASLRPSIFYGYSYHVARIARIVEERGIKTPELRLVATSGDLLLPHFRSIIRRVWDVEAIDIYSSSELGDMAWQCRRRERLHLNADQYLFEFLRDGREVREGEQGEIVATHLYRRSMPLIRYSPGDLGAPTGEPCACGIRLPLMQSLQGRLLNAVPLPNGRVFVGFNRLMSDEPAVVAYQVVQTALDDFSVRLVLKGSDPQPAVVSRVEKEIIRHLGEDVRVRAREVAESELIRRGNKVPAVIPFEKVDFGNDGSGSR